MIKNTTKSYGLVAIFFHWLMALGVFFMFGLGLYMVELSYYDAWYKGSLDLHKSIGVLLFIVFCFRLSWRLINVSPEPPSTHNRLVKLEQFAARTAHYLLYLILLFLMMSGYFISTADGRGIVVLNWFEVPASPLMIENQEDLAGEVHLILAWSLISLVIVHSAAALKHHFVNKDDTFKKMLNIKRSIH